MKNLITLKSAKEKVKLFLNNKNKVISSEYADRNIISNSETVDAKAVRLILDQPDCQGFRLYYGMNEQLEISAIFIGVDSNGNEITIKNLDGNEDEYVLDDTAKCPPLCPPLENSKLI